MSNIRFIQRRPFTFPIHTALQWTGDNVEEMEEFAGHSFDAGSNPDIQVTDWGRDYTRWCPVEDIEYDPEATAWLYGGRRQPWIPMRTGDWVVQDRFGRVSRESAECIENVYQFVNENGKKE